MYWDPAAHTSRLEHLKSYWYARAGCEVQSQVAAVATEKGAAYEAAGAMLRSGAVDAAGYALLRAHALEPLLEPLLAVPRHAAMLEQYARRNPAPNMHDLPAEEAFNLLYKEGDYARAVALINRLGREVLQESGMLELRYAYADYRFGRRRTAWALIRTYLRPIPNEIPDFSIRASLVTAFAEDGYSDTAWRLVEQARRSHRGMLIRKYVEASGIFHLLENTKHGCQHVSEHPWSRLKGRTFCPSTWPIKDSAGDPSTSFHRLFLIAWPNAAGFKSRTGYL